MLKKIIITKILALVIFLNSFAQTQYFHSQYAGVDSSYIYSQVNGLELLDIDFSYTGENITWDFSGIEVISQQEEFFISPNQSGYFESFMFTCLTSGGNYYSCYTQWTSLSNLALKTNREFYLVAAEISNFTEFQKKSNTKVESTMLGVNVQYNNTQIPFTITYSEPDVLINFPVSFQDADTSISGFLVDLSPYGYELEARRWQKRINTVDGWGSLTTPFATFPQTLRMFTTNEIIDTIIFQNDTIALPRIELLIQWFSPLYGQAVFRAHGLQSEEGSIFHSVDFIDSLRCLPASAGFLYYPISPMIDAEERFVDVSFINSSLNATHYSWDFGDTESGSNNYSDLKNPIHTFTNGGNYYVTLAVRNEICEPVTFDTMSLMVLIADTADVTAAFSHTPEVACLGSNFLFNSESQNAYLFHWDFGDGNTSTSMNPNHSYNEAGIYSVTLTASNTTKSDEVTHEVSVYPITIANAGPDTTIVKGNSVTLQGSGGDFLSSYVWDDSEYLSCTNCQNPLASPQETTTFYLTVSDLCNESRDSVTVNVVPPVSVPSTLEKGFISIYPNPNNGMFTIYLPYAITCEVDIAIYSTLGQTVWKSTKLTISEKSISVNSSNLQTGFYIITVKTSEVNLKGKLQIRR
jgi:PKD repeat protein